MAGMHKSLVKIPHVSWRDGRPRFNPGPKLRALRFQGEDLRHPDGRWFSADETAAWVKALLPDIEKRRQDRRAGRRVVAPGRKVYRLADLLTAWQNAPLFREKACKTQSFYRQMLGILERDAPALWSGPALALTTPKAFTLYEDLSARRGRAMARAVIATLSTALSWGMRRGLVVFPVNPCHRLGMVEPAPRLRAGEVFEMQALVAAADAIGRHDVGDMITLALWSGQRQADRFHLLEGAVVDGRRYFRQGKTGAIVMVPEAPELTARLKAARARRARRVVDTLHVVIDEAAGAPWRVDGYRRAFTAVRATAVEGIPGRLAPCPSLADFTDQDLRDTAVTWLARAGATDPEIAAVTGHELASVKRILKHYLAMHPELADNAIGKLTAWHASKTS